MPAREFLGTGELDVCYPCGNKFTLYGELYFGQAAPDTPPQLYAEASGPTMILDPRATVDADGERVYSPRDYLSRLPAWAQEWLAEHPTWG